jgi:hypothetical protein
MGIKITRWLKVFNSTGRNRDRLANWITNDIVTAFRANKNLFLIVWRGGTLICVLIFSLSSFNSIF